MLRFGCEAVLAPVTKVPLRSAPRSGAWCALLTAPLLLVVSGCMSSFGGGSNGPAIATSQAGQAATPVGLVAVLNRDAEVAAFTAQEEALRAPAGGVAIPWSGGSAKGTVTPGPVHLVNRRACRDIVHEAIRDRERIFGRATLCRTADGGWVPLEDALEKSALTTKGHGS